MTNSTHLLRTASDADAASTGDALTMAIIVGAVAIAMAVFFLVTFRARRNDVARLDARAGAGRIESETATQVITDLIASAEAAVPAHRTVDSQPASGALFGTTRVVGASDASGLVSRLTRARLTTQGTITHAWIDAAADAGRPGVVAMLRLRETAKGKKGSSTTWREVVVLRTERPVAGSVQFARTDGQEIDLSNLGRVGDWLESTGLYDGLLSDPDLSPWFMGSCELDTRERNRLVAADEGLRALLWSMRRRIRGERVEPNVRTDRYESMIAPVDAGDLSSITIVGDLMILEAASSPLRAGPSDDILRLANSVVADFR